MISLRQKIWLLLDGGRLKQIVSELPCFTNILTFPLFNSIIDQLIGTNRSEALLKAYVNTVPLEKCNNTLIDSNLGNLASLRGLSASQMCASNLVVGSDACQGDSGGPLFIHERLTGVSTIVGIVSFGISCATDLPGVYTRVGSFVEWIESTVWP